MGVLADCLQLLLCCYAKTGAQHPALAATQQAQPTLTALRLGECAAQLQHRLCLGGSFRLKLAHISIIALQLCIALRQQLQVVGEVCFQLLQLAGERRPGALRLGELSAGARLKCVSRNPMTQRPAQAAATSKRTDTQLRCVAQK